MKYPNLSEWAIKNQSTVLYLLLALLLSGALAYFELPQKEDPDFTFKVMTVKVRWPGSTALEMEQQVTDRLERALQETPWLDNVSSATKPGVTEIFVTLKDSTPPAELDHAWQVARKKLADMRRWLPENIQEPEIDDEFGDTFGSIYALTSDTLSPAELTRQANQVRHELLHIKEVRKIKLVGVQREKIYIEFSSAQIAQFGTDPRKVAAILKAQNVIEPAGEIVTQDDVTRVNVSGDFHSLQSIQDIGIPTRLGIRRLGDISYVYRDYEDPPRLIMKYKGKEAVGLAILMAQDADVAALGSALDKKLETIRTQLPPGVQIHQVADQPKVVKRAISQFMRALLEALIIVTAVSFLSLGWRAGLVVALSIPIVLSGTFLLMKIFGIDLHRVSVGALIIAIGLLVDDAMIAVEMIKVKLEQGWDKKKAAIYAYRSTAFPMLTGTLITAAAFLPVGLAKSSAGEYTFSICVVVTFALLVSWLVAVIFTPFIGYHLLSEHPGHSRRLYDNPFYNRFRKLVVWCLAHRSAVISATVAIFVFAILGFGKVEQQFFPSSERAELLMDVWLPEGATFASTEAAAADIEQILAKDGDIVQYTSYIGGSTPRFYLPLDLQLPASNYAQIVIATRDLQAREAVLKRVRKILDSDFPDAGVRIARMENGPPVGYPIQFRVTGTDTAKIRAIANDVMQVVKQNKNTRHVSQDSNEPVKTLNVEVNQEKARELGLSSQGVSRYLQAMLSGLGASNYLEDGKHIGIVIRASEGDRKSIEFLSRIKMFAANGELVPLSSFAQLNLVIEEGIIWRMDFQPMVTVRADIPDDVQAPDVSAAIDKNLAAIRARLPNGYRIEAGGAMEENDKSTDSIIAILPLMTFIILTLLMLQLRSFGRVILVLLTAPLGIIGVTAALLPFHVPFGFVAMLGMISLAGMIMRNSVILVDQIEQDMEQGLSRYDAIVDSTVRRSRPILLTAAAAILAMIPLTQSVFWGPMAIVIMGGLFVATLLTLLYLPALYAAWFRVKQE